MQTPLARLAAFVLAGLAPGGVSAATLTESSTRDHPSTVFSVRDRSGGEPVTPAFNRYAPILFPGFQTNKGVLTGVTYKLLQTATMKVDLSANTNLHPVATFTGSGDAQLFMNFPGLGRVIYPKLSATVTCREQPGDFGCSASKSVSQPLGTVVIPMSALGQYLTGHVLERELVYSAGSPLGQPADITTTTTMTLAPGVTTRTFSYLRHAEAGLSTLDIDFGDIALGHVVDPRAFAVNALGDEFTAGLDLDSIVASGDTDRLSTNLAGFRNLSAGQSRSFLASIDTSAAGAFAADYALNFSDADVGAGMRNSQLLLRLRGNVIGPAATVPEPTSWAVLILGFGLAGAGLRRACPGGTEPGVTAYRQSAG